MGSGRETSKRRQSGLKIPFGGIGGVWAFLICEWNKPAIGNAFDKI